MSGTLFLCGTPIGNLEDSSFRLLRTLKSVDVIAAEDTRRTRRLLTHFGIKAKVIAYNDVNEVKQTQYLLMLIASGKRVALVTDGGMPAISDPGYKIICACIETGANIEVVPGPSAPIAALVVSGLATARFTFEGFLPRKEGELKRRLENIKHDDRTMIFFEAANRVRGTVSLAQEILGDRQAALCRELTKIHEEVMRGKLSEIADQMGDTDPLGEVVLVIEGASLAEGGLAEAVTFARELVDGGSPKSKAASQAARTFGVVKKHVYDELLKS